MDGGRMKIKVKDYYAIQRAKARNKSLTREDRQEIAKCAAMKRWHTHKIRSFKQTLDVVK